MKPQLPDFSKANVLVIGDIMLDRYWFGDALRISPEAPVPVVKVQHVDERPGGAANVALNIAALTTQVHLIGVTGDDTEATTLAQQLDAARVQHDLHRNKAAPTITKLRVISRHQQLIRLDFEKPFPAIDEAALLASFQAKLPKTNVVLLSDYGKGTLVNPQKLIALARAAKVPVLVDPKGQDFSIYRGATIITPNFKEFEAVVGHCRNEEDIVKKGRQLIEDYDFSAVLLTRGEMGMTLLRLNEPELHVPARGREVFDVTGAGDTVIAVFGATIAAGADLPLAMALANIAAGLVVGKLGAATVSVPELQIALTEDITLGTGCVNEDQLLLSVTAARNNGEKIVFTNGCFDILHAGHLTYLKQAKQLGNRLIVAINDDASVSRLKGPGRPINSTEQRMAVLAGLGFVDWVVSFSGDTPHHLLNKLQPDILVKGGDYGIEGVVGAEVVRAYGGEVRVLGLIKGVSTTSIIDRAVSQHQRTQKTEET